MEDGVYEGFAIACGHGLPANESPYIKPIRFSVSGGVLRILEKVEFACDELDPRVTEMCFAGPDKAVLASMPVTTPLIEGDSITMTSATPETPADPAPSPRHYVMPVEGADFGITFGII